MEFDVRVVLTPGEAAVSSVVVEADNWFSALQEALVRSGQELGFKNLLFSLQDDGYSAELIELGSGCIVEVNARISSGGEASLGGGHLEATLREDPRGSESASEVSQKVVPTLVEGKGVRSGGAFVSSGAGGSQGEGGGVPQRSSSSAPKRSSPLYPVYDDSSTVPLPSSGAGSSPSSLPVTSPSEPAPDSSTFGVKGQYQPGATADILTEAFMKLSDLYERFGEDQDRTMGYVMSLALLRMRSLGAGILLTDINTPQDELHFRHLSGPHEKELQNIVFPMGQGAVGFSAREGVLVNLSDLSQEERFADDPLLLLELPVGPFLSAPLHYQQQLRGAILLYRQRGETPFTRGEEGILDYIAFSLGRYLHQLQELAPFEP